VFVLFCIIISFLCLFLGHFVVGGGKSNFCLLYFWLIITFSFCAIVSTEETLICFFVLSQSCYRSLLGFSFVLFF
jgi:hypothetical protein